MVYCEQLPNASRDLVLSRADNVRQAIVEATCASKSASKISSRRAFHNS